MIAPDATAGSLKRLVRRLVAIWKEAFGLCPTDGCWNDSGHVGCCPECWNSKPQNAKGQP